MADFNELMRPVSPLPEEDSSGLDWARRDQELETLRKMVLATRRAKGEGPSVIADEAERAYEHARVLMNKTTTRATTAACTSDDNDVGATTHTTSTPAASSCPITITDAISPCTLGGAAAKDNPYSNYIAALESQLRKARRERDGGAPRSRKRLGEPVPADQRRRLPSKRRVYNDDGEIRVVVGRGIDQNGA